MKRGAVGKLMRALDDAMEQMLTSGIPELDARQKRAVLRVAWRDSRERRLIGKQAAKAPEPNENEMESAVIELTNRLNLLKSAMDRAVQKAKSTRRGPQSTIPKQKHRDVCLQIKALAKSESLPRGKSIREAVLEIAKLYRVNERTIYRIWRRRSELLP